MKKEDITNFRIQKVIDDEKNYPFPEFIRLLRRMHGTQRKRVSEDTGIPETRLFYLEKGRFKRRLGNDEVKLLSEYYNIDQQLIKKKVSEFLKSGEAKAQYEKT